MNIDAKLKQQVMDELEWESSLNSAGIGVAVKNGIVTLSGRVASYYEKAAAEKAVRRVKGVKAVVEEIETDISSGLERTDEDIASAAIRQLKWNNQVPDEDILLKVEDGLITLEGEVDWNYQREEAKKAVQNLTGVRGVFNHIKIKPSAQPKDLKNRIRNSFERNALIDANHVKVEVEDHKVILSGDVQSWAEKKQAERVAWSSPGVTAVENKIEIKVPQDYVV